MRAVALCIALSSLSCLITEAPGDPPATDPRAPVILDDQAQPPITNVITRIDTNTTLDIPVDADPRTALKWNLVVDFDPQTGGNFALQDQDLAADTTTLQSPRHIIVPLFANVDDSHCHTLTVLVAQSFEVKSPWTPKPPGGAMIVWFYRPNGNDGTCPTFDPDAGKYDAISTDAGTD